MSRGKGYNHKEKGHPGAFPNDTKIEEKEPDRSMKDVADFATYEAYKNRVKDDEDEE
ncbi:hypothetical protein EV207_11750 [Scopulibacillus darangshiensis]|uniref:Uncharacterized protein n=1 Tax=Scopulibacillus darangshiensis TaxID=442528 RepID=A0A4R2NZQ6_9BACL|nr:hypothetical protein [Scopulibacillus darangshiensis]TCP27823.1 hypothetical protein EV207_11750 [Scopulibacillus darangshiensis]